MFTANGHTRFSVIIPALNEESAIGTTIDRVRALNADVEIVVADGGSEDATTKIAREHGAIVVPSRPGRGIQCNAGARRASGDIFIFLHADTLLPEDAFEFLDKAFAGEAVNIGTFRLRFDRDRLLLKFYTFFTRFDSIFTTFGDQVIVVRGKFFRLLGGFPEWKIFEDVEFLKRARLIARIRKFPLRVTTSARRFIANGVVRQQLRNCRYVVQFMFGAGHEYLAGQYAKTSRPGAALIVFARYPTPGKVKSRLAADIGPQDAALAYAACAQKIFNEARRVLRFTESYVYSPPEDARDAMISRAGTGFRYRTQSGSSLGERMADAFENMFSHNCRHAVIVGADIIGLNAAIMDRAVELLVSADIVLGPALDGGYYLIGMNRLHQELFQNIAWGSTTVREQTISIANQSGLKVALLAPLRDLDTLEDYNELRAMNAQAAAIELLRGMS